MSFDVSVIVPTYNRADLIPETLRSILEQTRPPAEVIVVDDGSTDETADVVRGFGAAVQYLRIENSGVCRARNVGYQASKAPWIAFCDSDDLWRRDKLEQQALLFESAPDVGYGFTNFQPVVDGEWRGTTKFDTAPAGFWDFPRREIDAKRFVIESPFCEAVLRFQPIFPSTVVLSRTFYEKVGGWVEDLGRTLSEDLEFTFRCVAQGSLGVVTDPVVGIRKHTTNFSGSVAQTLAGEAAILSYILRNHPEAEPYRRSIEEQIVRRSADAGELAFAAGDIAEARRLLRNLPGDRLSFKQQAKKFIVGFPDGVARLARRILVR